MGVTHGHGNQLMAELRRQTMMASQIEIAKLQDNGNESTSNLSDTRNGVIFLHGDKWEYALLCGDPRDLSSLRRTSYFIDDSRSFRIESSERPIFREIERVTMNCF
jgi:hypothetical protein